MSEIKKNYGYRSSLKALFSAPRHHQRSREPVTRSRMTYRGRFPSFKMGRMVDWESQLERRACYRFEFSPAVITFHEQPEPIRFFLGDQYIKYTPDFELTLENGDSWVVEVKPLQRLQKPDLLQRLTTASDMYSKNGKKFVVITDEELLEPALEANLVRLRRFQSIEIDESLIEHAIACLRNLDSPTINDVHELYGDDKTAFVLLSRHIINANLHLPLHAHSTIYFQEEYDYESLLFSYRTAPDFQIS